MVDLAVEIGGLRLANPVMPASGTFAEGLARIIDFNRLGAFVIKTVTRELRAGNPTPRVAETAGGMLNSIGIPSKGVDYFFKETLPFYRQFTPPLIASLSAPTADGFASLAAELSVPGVAAIEANISCPNLEEDGRAFAMTAHSTEAVMKRLRAATKLPLWAKLTPNTGDIADVARAAEAAGGDAVVVANTILAMSIDVDTFRPTLGSVTGGLSGPAIKPVILRQVYQCARAVKIGIVGCGGIATAEDAVQYLLAGARAVQIGTATFVHPNSLINVLDGLERFCGKRGFGRVGDLTGALIRGGADETDVEWAGAAG
ncbi:MAG TPA: dihydroorotate dehydrogenase [Stellaceae bacterium]|nr:dihydroorotate dehydrogenase [Stellaceae bacterium]